MAATARGWCQLKIRVLGPLELHVTTGPLSLGAPKQRLLLALLLFRGDMVVPVAHIVDELWGDEPPQSAESNVRLYAGNLRRLLAAWPDAPSMLRRGSGYQLAVADAEFDLRQFRELVTGGRESLQRDDFRAAADQLQQGLGLWRGPAVADLPCGRLLTGWRHALAEERMSAAEDHAEALLGLDQPDQVLTDVGEVVAGAPWREHAQSLLMRARYQAGDVAGALAAYDTARRYFVDELGIEPAAELVRLQKAILNRDPALTPPRPAAFLAASSPATGPATSLATPVPRQLPADVVGFAGRTVLLGCQDELLARQARGGALPAVPVEPLRPAGAGARVSVITGPAGIGKTAFALHWAHRASREFPDGQLYVNLKGFDPALPPVAPAAALHRFLDAFGVPSARIPADVDARAALFRTVLAGRRVLVVLDNARDAEQVRPMLPGTPGCSTVVTSRDRLDGLVAIEGALPIPLDMLSPAESRELLTHRLGESRMAAEPEAVAQLLTGCAGLPLALTIVAARAATHPEFTLAALAAELRDVRARLDVFTVGDSGGDMRDVLSWSYRRLSPAAARLLRLLGSHAGPETTAPAAASLAGVPVAEVRPLLAELTRLHLLTEPAPGRHGFHDLIRAYAGDLAAGEGPSADNATAQRRLLDHYNRTARTATERLAPRQERFALAEPEPGAGPEDMQDAATALAWFSAEEHVLLAAVQQATEAGLDAYTFEIAWALADFSNRCGHWETLLASSPRLKAGDSRG